MKKQTKQRIAALVIVIIFGMSSIAFVFGFLSGTPQQQNSDLKPLEKFIVEGPVDPRLEEAYYKGGFSWMKFYYTDKTDLLYSSVDQFPDIFKAPNGQQQLIIQKLESNESYVYVYSVNGQEEITAPTEEQLLESVCRILVLPPPDCVFLNQTKTNSNTVINSSSNSTSNNTQNNTV